MNNPIRQHFIPHMVQHGFLTQGETRLWVYDRKVNQFRQQSPRDIAVQANLYSINDHDLEEHKFAVEKALASLETDVAPILKRLRQGGLLKSQTEWNRINEYLGLQAMRTPQYLSIMKEMAQRVGQAATKEFLLSMANLQPDEFEKRLQEIATKTGKSYDQTSISQESLRDAANKESVQLTPHPDLHIAMMIEAGTELGRKFSGRKLTVIHTKPNHSFISGDVPIVQQATTDYRDDVAGYGPGAPGVVNIFPFASDTAIVVHASSERGGYIEHATCPNKETRKLNNQLARSSDRIIFSHSERLLRSLAERLKLDQWRPEIIYYDEAIRGIVHRALE